MKINEYPENDRNNYALSIGIRNEDFLKLSEIYKYTPEKCNIVCIDIATLYSKISPILSKSKKINSPLHFIAGNVVTREMVEEQIINGQVDIVKVGIGSGSVCTIITFKLG